MEGRATNLSWRHRGLRPARYGFRPGGCGLREGRGPGFRPRGVRASGREGAGFGRVMLLRSSGKAVTSDGQAAASAEEVRLVSD
jgi:hypothetical protein